MPRPTNRESRRKQIVAGLRRIMSRRGYDGASIADIARAARLAPGLVHYHFRDKQEVLLALIDELVTAHGEQLDGAAAGGGAAAGELGRLLDAHLAVGRGADPEALACWVVVTTEALRRPRVAKAVAAVLGRLRARFEAVIARGVTARELHVADPAAAAAGLVAVIQGYYVVAACARLLIPRWSAARTARAMAAGLVGRALPAVRG